MNLDESSAQIRFSQPFELLGRPQSALRRHAYLLIPWVSLPPSPGVVSRLAFTHPYLLKKYEQSKGPSLHEVVLSSLHQYYDPLGLPSCRHATSPFGLIGSHFTDQIFFLRAGEGLPRSRVPFDAMPLPLRRRVLRCCFPSSPQLPWPSSICAGLGSLFSLSRGLFDDAAEFTSCYGLVSCSPCSLPGTFVDALLRTDFAVRRHPSYSDVLALSEVRLSLTRGTRASGRATNKKATR